MCNIRLLDEEDEKKILIDIRHIAVSRVKLKGRYNPHEYCSRIQLLGKWVRDSGFEPDDKLTVSVYKGRIVIEKEQPVIKDAKPESQEQKLTEEYVRERVRKLVSPEIFKQLSFKNGEISWIK
ncbi:SymE family type I addiction module toxin [Elizabethkingia meningoseptica]|uniref:SymE family type I addiction module toxin n=1 Tax=Elizabethkingia meningoseptica TaxID=238 RepID=UPI000B35095E|nr:SymE family type I addiction module toxin [Elizabethkingia meningoseptica]